MFLDIKTYVIYYIIYYVPLDGNLVSDNVYYYTVNWFLFLKLYISVKDLTNVLRNKTIIEI